MAFVEFFQFLGYHAAGLGAFLISLLVVALICWISYHLGKREANRKWTWDVEHMPAVIGQDVMERYQRRLTELTTQVRMYKEREQRLGPAVAGAAAAVSSILESKDA